MPFKIAINVSGTKWEKPLSQKEFFAVKERAENVSPATFMGAALRPIRTHNFKDFAKDFFLPTTINRAVRISNLALRLFAILGAIPFDLVTLPIRLFTVFPQIYNNRKLPKADHPLYRYLIEQKAPESILKHDCLELTLDWEERVRAGFAVKANSHETTPLYRTDHWYERIAFHFISHPSYPGCGYHEKGRRP